MEIVFKDLEVLRMCIDILNGFIEKYGHVDVGNMNVVCIIPGHIESMVDYKYGWTEKFSENDNVGTRRLMNGQIVFIFTIPESKEL